MKRILFVCVCCASLTQWGCNRSYDPVPADSEFIFPMEDGKTRTYFVIDTNYASASGLYDASTYYRREIQNGTETDLMGRTVEKLWNYISPDSTDSLGNLALLFEFSELWTQYKGEQYAERIEGNTRYAVLKLPVYQGISWNGNQYNNLPAQAYSYLSMDTTLTLGGETFEHCVFVLQTPYRESGLRGGVIFIQEYAWEVYAPHVGRIARYYKYYHEESGIPKPESRVIIETLSEHN